MGHEPTANYLCIILGRQRFLSSIAYLRSVLLGIREVLSRLISLRSIVHAVCYALYRRERESGRNDRNTLLISLRIASVSKEEGGSIAINAMICMR